MQANREAREREKLGEIAKWIHTVVRIFCNADVNILALQVLQTNFHENFTCTLDSTSKECVCGECCYYSVECKAILIQLSPH